MEEVLTTGMNSAGDARPRTGWRSRIKKEGLSTTIVQQARSMLFSLSNTFKLYQERAQARCL
jgi:hypothetical protein